jgi:HAD superfamily hydrolase (TIGR01549 family)
MNIIFDLDNTLVFSDKAYDLALDHCQIDAQRYQQARSNVKRVLNQKFQSPSARSRLLYFKEYFHLGGKPHSANDVLGMNNRYETKMLECLADQVESLGRKDFLEKLKAKADLYILTNENLKTQLAKISVIDPQGRFFKGILTSEEFGFEKPDRGIFEHLLVKYNLKASECFMVGDDYENDIQPSLALGMKAIQTTEFVTNKGPTGHVIVNDLNKVLEFV